MAPLDDVLLSEHVTPQLALSVGPLWRASFFFNPCGDRSLSLEHLEPVSTPGRDGEGAGDLVAV